MAWYGPLRPISRPSHLEKPHSLCAKVGFSPTSSCPLQPWPLCYKGSSCCLTQLWVLFADASQLILLEKGLQVSQRACLWGPRHNTLYTLPTLALFDATYPFYMSLYVCILQFVFIKHIRTSLYKFVVPNSNRQPAVLQLSCKQTCLSSWTATWIRQIGGSRVCLKMEMGIQRYHIGYPMVSVLHVQTNPHLDFVVCWWRGNNFHKDPNRKWLAASNRFIRHGLWKEGGKWIVYIPWISATFGDYDRQSGHL